MKRLAFPVCFLAWFAHGLAADAEMPVAEPVWSAATESQGIRLTASISGLECASWKDLGVILSITNLREEDLTINWPDYGGWERLNLFDPTGKKVPPTPEWAESMDQPSRHIDSMGRPGIGLTKGQKTWESRYLIAKLFQTDNPGGHVLKIGWVQGQRRGVPYPADPNLRIEVRLPEKLPAKQEDFKLVFPPPQSVSGTASQSSQETPTAVGELARHTSALPWLLGGAAVVLGAGSCWFLRRKAKGA